MPVSVTMPRLGESVTEGTVTRWLKQEGDQVTADEPLLEVSTDKVDTEVPSPASGVLTSIKVAEDETVEIGVELAVISEAGESSGSGDSAPAEASQAEEAPADAAQSDEAPAETQAESEPAQPEPEPESAPAEPEPEPAAQPAAEQRPEPAAAPAAAPPAAPAQAAAPPAAAPAAAAPPAADVQADDDEIAGTYVTPLVRKLASEHGVDLNALTGTGVGGRIRKSDVLNAANEAAQRKAEAEAAPAPAAPAAPAAEAAASPAPSPGQAQPVLRGRTEKLSRLRQVIAARMVESLQISAQLTTVVEVDVTRIARLRQAAKSDFERREGVKLSFLPFFAIAAVEALKEHPNVNCSVDTEAGTVTYHEAEHLGIAVDTERGLLVPVIHNAGDLNLGGIARKIADLAERTRTNKVSPDELGGGTFTLTNTGSRGALFDTPIINQPQVAILGTGSVVKRPVVISDENLGETIAIRSMVYLALSYDHRIVDGADAARFLGTMKSRLEAGAFERALGLGQG
jgi:2-oxoglutarate dehydrogenase E2 component (dihydrolipoamide succinyltransferase)